MMRSSVSCLLTISCLTLACASDRGSGMTVDTGTESGTGGTEPPTCSNNGQIDGEETDVDCGGPHCPGCEEGQMCLLNGDCISLACIDSICGDPTCSDGAKNQDETGVDCGGSCDPCGTGEGCADDGDCQSGKCVDGVCEGPTCDDGLQNGTESDVDCGGTMCDGCPDGGSCGANDDCASGYCMDGTCTPKACESDEDCSHLTTPCVDGVCNLEDFTCIEEPTVDCSHLDDQCVVGVCNESDGSCGTDPINEDQACDDGDACTADDVCQAGTCVDPSGPDVHLNEAFADNSAGWALGDNWEIGPATQSPQGGAGTGADPAMDHTPTGDNGVAGVLIGGLTSGSQQLTYLESASMDLQNASGMLTLSLWRWLNSDVNSKMPSVIEAYDGNGWIPLWENDGNAVVADDAWTLQELDVTDHKNADFRIRVGYRATGSAADVGGWNVDDVLLAPPGCQP
jgi:hypothetical protein